MKESKTTGFEPPKYDDIRYFIVGARPVMLVRHEGRMWTESIDWETKDFKRDMDYLARVIDGTNVEVDAVDLETFVGQVVAIRGRRA